MMLFCLFVSDYFIRVRCLAAENHDVDFMTLLDESGGGRIRGCMPVTINLNMIYSSSASTIFLDSIF
jgi:hypothetical protein